MQTLKSPPPPLPHPQIKLKIKELKEKKGCMRMSING